MQFCNPGLLMACITVCRPCRALSSMYGGRGAFSRPYTHFRGRVNLTHEFLRPRTALEVSRRATVTLEVGLVQGSLSAGGCRAVTVINPPSNILANAEIRTCSATVLSRSRSFALAAYGSPLPLLWTRSSLLQRPSLTLYNAYACHFGSAR